MTTKGESATLIPTTYTMAPPPSTASTTPTVASSPLDPTDRIAHSGNAKYEYVPAGNRNVSNPCDYCNVLCAPCCGWCIVGRSWFDNYNR
jgi:hypothetical protein